MWPMMPDLTETVEKQNVIIQMQSGIINELFQLLMQHISVDEADALPVVQRINEAADLRKWMERGVMLWTGSMFLWKYTKNLKNA